MIPISRPVISDDDIRLVSEAVASGWVSSLGQYIDRFERQFAEFCGVKHCVALANGTVAIHLALKALGIGEGDEVIVPDLTFVATANMVRLAGAEPVIVDVRTADWCLDPSAVERAITPRTRALIPVHLYGHPAEMNELRAIAQAHELKVVEDAAEAHGATYGGRRVGALGDCATFSFYGNKIITTGEGGALTTDSDEIAERARILRDHAMSKQRRYWHAEVGFNYRMTNLQAALGVAQLARIDEFIAERDRILLAYRRYLDSDSLRLNPRLEGATPVNWMTCVLLNDPDRARRDRVIGELFAHGVEARPFFYPLSALPMYEGHTNPVAADLSARGLNLPTYPGLPDADIETVSRTLLRAIESN
jgi:perosamine synthetase